MNKNIKNVIDALETLNNNGLVPYEPALTIVCQLHTLQSTLDRLQTADRPLRASEIAGKTLSTHRVSASLRRLVRAGMVRRVKLGEETLTLHKRQRYENRGTIHRPKYVRVEGEPFEKTVDIIGFELVR